MQKIKRNEITNKKCSDNKISIFDLHTFADSFACLFGLFVFI